MAAHGHLSPPPRMFTHWPGSPPSDSSASVRSSSSLGGLSSSSSLASAFSDIPPPLSTGLKTHAFFASPFAKPDMSGPAPSDPEPPTPPRSITADFFATPVRSPSPPRRAKAAGILRAIHPSRIFPSRYTARHDDDNDEKQFVELDVPVPAPSPSPSTLPLPSHTNPHRLPTPPPPSSPYPPRTLALPDDDEPTPRPAHLEPAYTSSAVPEPHYVDPSPGCIITSNPPCISNPPGLILTVTPPPNTTTFAAAAELDATNFERLSQPDSLPNNSQLHLIRPLGQGAFSSVWLAQDKSLIPLTLRSRKYVRELRKKASIANLSRRSSFRGGGLYSIGSDNGSAISLSRNPSLEDKYGTFLERESSLRMRKLKARVSGTRPVGFGTRYVDERHGEMGIKELTSVIDPSASGSDMEHSALYSSPPISASNSTSSAPDTADGEPCNLKKKRNSQRGRLVAVKMTPRGPAMESTPGMTKREREGEEERTRVGFVREVEILKHVSHPNITVLLEHMSTSSHHILVLPYLPGGDLLGLVNNDIAWSKLGENVLRRIWCELCKAVGWMHGVGLVHRDIKLENILLTSQCFSRLTPSSPRLTLDSLPTPPTPLIKLSDFGLSRFIEVDERTGEGELLWTRCGSEAYAAPELVMGTGSVRAQAANNHKKRHVFRSGGGGGSSGGSNARGGDYHQRNGDDDNDEERNSTDRVTTRGFYDARETDAWACGVVLYALVGRRLPFGEGVGAVIGSSREEEEEEDLEQRRRRIGGDGVFGNGGAGGGGYGYGRRRGSGGGMMERRQWLMKIARGEYEWPAVSVGGTAPTTTMCLTKEHNDDDDELVGQQLVQSQGVKRIVGRLLVRDPRNRARIMDLWDDDWMWGVGGGLAIGMNQVEWKERERDRRCHQQQQQQQQEGVNSNVGDGVVGLGDEFNDGDALRPDEEAVVDELGGTMDGCYADEGALRDGQGGDSGEVEEEEVEEELVDGEEGWLLDQEGIGSVARQEVV